MTYLICDKETDEPIEVIDIEDSKKYLKAHPNHYLVEETDFISDFFEEEE